MAKRIIHNREMPLVVRQTLGCAVGHKINEETRHHGKLVNGCWNYDESHVSSVIAQRSDQGDYVATVTFDRVIDRVVDDPEDGFDDVHFDTFTEKWRLVINEPGRILSESYEDDSFGL